MMYFIYGGSGSGKSAFGEKLAVMLGEKGSCPLYYIATMYPYDEECKKRIQKHKQMRKNKGFKTIECYGSLDNAVIEKSGVVLLECMSNLLANRMYGNPSCRAFRDENLSVFQTSGDFSKALLKDLINQIQSLAARAEDVIIISNNIFYDSQGFDKETETYIKCLSQLNQAVVKISAYAQEIVFGIPIAVKRETEVME